MAVSPLLVINLAISLLELIERGNAAVVRMRELQAKAEAGELTDEYLVEAMTALEDKVEAYREGIKR